MPTVTCVITSFNNGAYLRASIESVLAQSRRPDEIIVADDGSTDGSRELIRAFATEHQFIRPVFRDQNLGVATNRDRAVREARSDYVTTLDGDDIFYPTKIADELASLDGSLDEVAFSDVDHLDAAGQVVLRLDHKAFAALDRARKLRYLLFREGPIPRDMMFSKRLFEQVNGYRDDLALYEDWDLKLRLVRDARQWKYTGKPGVGYRRHGQGLSSADGLTHLECQLRVILGNRDWLTSVLGAGDIYNALLTRIVSSMGYRGVKLVR